MLSNLFSALPPAGAGEHSDELLRNGEVRIERIVSHGEASPPGFWYDEAWHEWVVLLKGRAVLRFADEPAPRRLEPGDCIAIAAHRRHRVEATAAAEPTLWLAVHYR
ncbi:MAG TPA: cupin domain-containing protein [Alphaproteobacteria bacterium]|nr:cupin domain-containing protein [Alphaproteobacteria bacterium]